MIYAVWIKKRGWLRNEKGIFASEEIEVAQAVAKFWGNKAFAIPVDDTAKDFEQQFLEAEKQRRWIDGLS